MKKTYLRAAVASLGLFTSTFLIHAQGAGGGGAGGAAGSAGAGTVGGTGAAGSAGAATAGRVAPAGSANTVGGASIVRPAGAPPVGAASTIQANPNTVGGSSSIGIAGQTPSTANGTVPSGVPPATAPGLQFNSLPGTVQSTLQTFSANGSLASVTAVPGQPGTFRASVVQNGVPMEMTIASNGRILSQVPITGTPAQASAANLAGVQAGMPLSSLPPALASSIQSQLGGAQVQSISRDDLANGSVFRVTALQNGVPTEMRFAANGTLLSSAPLTGTATSTLNPNVVPGGTIIPGGALVMDDLPRTVQDSLRDQLGDLRASRIMQQRAANGVNYVVSYMQDGRPMTMIIGPDGRVLSNGPANVAAVGASARAARGTATSGGETTRTTLRLDELPDDVENALKEKAPNAEVRTITREQRVGGDVYVVVLRDGDTAGEIEIDENGKTIRDDRRDLSALTPSAPVRPPREKAEGMPYEQLPIAIQNAIKAYATASDIRSITLGLDRDGKTVWDVVFYRDGRRDRMIVGKDGRLVRIEENVSPAFELPSSRKAPVLAIGDLPEAVQDTIRRQTDKVLVKDIRTKEVGGQMLYQVNYNTNGTPMELLVNNAGEVVLPQGDRESEKPGGPLRADVDKEEPDPVRIIDANKSNSDASGAAGAFATGERATGASAPPAIAPPAPAEVKLSDTPEAVQNTIKKMAGSGSIERITPKLGTAGVTYEVTFTEDDKPRTVILDRKGAVQNQKQPSVP